jgi:tetratricopeptide (TPR) repeat protein
MELEKAVAEPVNGNASGKRNGLKLTSAIILVLIFWIPQSGSSQTVEDMFAQANQQYQQGNYQKAKNLYEEIVRLQVANPDLYYNLGNACFRLKEYGHAVLYFERALKLNPNSSDIRFNLEKTKEHIRVRLQNEARKSEYLFEGSLDLLESFSSRYTPDIYGGIFLSVFGLFFLLLSLPILFRKRKWGWLYKLGVILGILVTLSAAALLFGNYYYRNHASYGIILAKKAPVRGHRDSSEKAFELYEGTKVKIIDKSDDRRWKIQLSSEWLGWVDTEDLGEI